MVCGRIEHVMSPTEYGSCDDLDALPILGVQWRLLGARRPLPDRPAGTPNVDVRDPRDKHATQMPPVRDQ